MKEEKRSLTVKDIINAILAIGILIPALMLNTYIAELYDLPKSLPVLSAILLLFVLRFIYVLSALSFEERVAFILTIIALFAFLAGVIVDWKYILWIDDAGLLVYFPFFPAVAYVFWTNRKSNNEST